MNDHNAERLLVVLYILMIETGRTHKGTTAGGPGAKAVSTMLEKILDRGYVIKNEST